MQIIRQHVDSQYLCGTLRLVQSVWIDAMLAMATQRKAMFKKKVGAQITI